MIEYSRHFMIDIVRRFGGWPSLRARRSANMQNCPGQIFSPFGASPLGAPGKLILPPWAFGPCWGAAPHLLQLLPSETYRPRVLLCTRLLRRKITNNNNNYYPPLYKLQICLPLDDRMPQPVCPQLRRLGCPDAARTAIGAHPGPRKCTGARQ